MNQLDSDRPRLELSYSRESVLYSDRKMGRALAPGGIWEEVHEALADLLLALMVLHVLGVVLGTVTF